MAGRKMHRDEAKIAGLVQVLLVLAVFSVAACTTEPAADRGKFRKLASDAEALKSSLAAGASYQQFADSLEKFSAGIGALRGSRLSKEETDILEAFSDLLAIYHDGLVLWRYKLEFVPFGFVPKGRIYVGQDVDPIVYKYRFATESHQYLPTGQYWKSIPEDSIRIIWSNADSQLKIIENMMKYQ